MFQIIRKMQYDVHPPTQSKTKVFSMSHRYSNNLHIYRFIIFNNCTFLVSYRGNQYWNNWNLFGKT